MLTHSAASSFLSPLYQHSVLGLRAVPCLLRVVLGQVIKSAVPFIKSLWGRTKQLRWKCHARRSGPTSASTQGANVGSCVVTQEEAERGSAGRRVHPRASTMVRIVFILTP